MQIDMSPLVHGQGSLLEHAPGRVKIESCMDGGLRADDFCARSDVKLFLLFYPSLCENTHTLQRCWDIRMCATAWEVCQQHIHQMWHQNKLC